MQIFHRHGIFDRRAGTLVRGLPLNIAFLDTAEHDYGTRRGEMPMHAVAVYGLRTMPEVLAESMSVRRLYTRLLEIFAGLALLLSAVGLYSAVSQSVSERTHEFGIRVAIGATAADVVRLVFSEGTRLMLGGSVVGLALALTLNRLLSSYLFGVSANDPATSITVCGVLLAVAAAATWFPVHRVTKVDPMVALSDE